MVAETEHLEIESISDDPPLKGNDVNLRHAAALALVGWYLMVPPPYGPEWYELCRDTAGDQSSPQSHECAEIRLISKWNHVGSYETADECEAARNRLVKNFKYKTPPNGVVTPEEAKDSMINSECIATDDPRLKEK